MEQFDPNIPGFMEASCTGVTLTAPAGFPAPALPNRVIDPTQDFTLHIEWEAFGALTTLWLAALSNTWRVEVFAESLGGGPEQRIASGTLNKNTTVPCTVNAAQPNCTKWELDVTVPANTLPEGAPAASANAPSGIYKMAISLFLDSNLGTPGYDIVGYHEGPIIQVENPA